MINLDAPSCVYVHRDIAGDVIYVGATSEFEHRTARHRRESLWRDEIAAVEIVARFRTWDDAHEAELALIRTVRPRHNTNNNNDALTGRAS